MAVGRKLVPGQWWLTTAGAKTTAIPQELVLAAVARLSGARWSRAACMLAARHDSRRADRP